MKYSRSSKTRWLALGGLAIAGVAYAATQITVKTPIALSDGTNGDKPKIQRAGDGTLVVAYGDTPVAAAANLVYDTKAGAERPARDIFVKFCKPDSTRTCDNKADWTLATVAGVADGNVSNSAAKSSISTAWRGTIEPGLKTYWGDTDKANIKTSGPVMVLTWVGNYCPDGDLATAGVQPSVQRAVRYLERDSRIIPFACTWTAYSTNNGLTWSAPIQLSNGERDAKQDASSGNYSSEQFLADGVTPNPNYKKGQINISWQEDPRGLQLGEADGPGDGASGANVSNGTDVWYTWATIDLSVASTPGDDFVLAAPSGEPRAQGLRITDNQTGVGIGGTDTANPVFDGTGVQVDKNTIETGQAGAARPNIGMVGTTAIVAYEETKGSEGLDEGKFVRYHAFPFSTPPTTVAGKAGCIISNPLKNARRVRFLTQSPADAGAGGIQIAIFWKEGIYDKGGPSDIVVRRGMGGLQPTGMLPTVDAACATSDYATAIALNQAPAENISSRSPVLTSSDTGLADDTEVNYVENALAHRGVLRGPDLWIGYSYTNDLVKMWAQLDNYNFWLRKYTLGSGWDLPKNVTNIEDKRINVREPRIFGTPKSTTACATDPTQCQNTSVVFLAWGTQENVSPFDPDGGDDLGIYITVSTDGAKTFATPVRYSTAAGSLFQDDESAYEAQIVTRPDGTRFYGVWNQANAVTKATVAEYASGDVTTIADPVVPPITPPTSGGGGGCTMATGDAPFDPTLPLLVALGLAGLGLRRVGARRG